MSSTSIYSKNMIVLDKNLKKKNSRKIDTKKIQAFCVPLQNCKTLCSEDILKNDQF